MTNVLKTFKSTILCCDRHERDNRIYPLKLVKKAIKENNVIQECLANHCLYGDLFKNYDTQVDLKEVAFVIRKLYWYKKELRAIVDILDTPNGRILNQCTTPIRIAILGSGDIDFTTNTVTSYKIEKFCVTWDFKKLYDEGKLN